MPLRPAFFGPRSASPAPLPTGKERGRDPASLAGACGRRYRLRRETRRGAGGSPASPAPPRACCRRGGRTSAVGIHGPALGTAAFVIDAPSCALRSSRDRGLWSARATKTIGAGDAVVGKDANPIEIVRLSGSSPGSAKSWCIMRRRSRSAKMAEPWSAVSGMTTTNSSPP